MEISELLEKQRACYASGKTRSVPYRAAALRRLYDTVKAQTPELEAALIGLRRHKDSVSGLLRAQDAVLGKDCALTALTLEQLMVYLEREAEK